MEDNLGTDYEILQNALAAYPVSFGDQEITAMPSQLFANIDDYVYTNGPSHECWQYFGGTSSPETERLTLAETASIHYPGLCSDMRSNLSEASRNDPKGLQDTPYLAENLKTLEKTSMRINDAVNALCQFVSFSQDIR
ncbi:MAG: hypothetical protein ACQESG_06500 [Nanobdellota archaeon]